jgi:hypothetical protein
VCSVLARNERSPLVLNLQRDGTPPPTSVTLYDSVSHRNPPDF